MPEEKKITLPQLFTERMKTMLQDEYGDFLAAYEKERWYGLRFNALKTNRETFLKRMPFTLEPVKWAEEGFYYKPEQQPGKHLFHEIGAYYIQEPSAMAVVEVLAPAPGERVLDLCAAPGGKSTQIAGKMMGEGLLVSNEIIPGRAKILSQNIERMGIANAVVCNETPERMAAFFPSFFDKILVDAPCSGEGMFRKDETAINEWSPDHVRMCAERQRSILEQAVLMLKPGGMLVYSTCTFSMEENEGVIGSFLRKHPEFSIEEAVQEKFFAPGRRVWMACSVVEQVHGLDGDVSFTGADVRTEGLEHTMRLWPHKLAGEGHFIAKLRRAGTLALTHTYGNSIAKDNGCSAEKGSGRKKEKKTADDMEPCCTFLREELGLSDAVYEGFKQKGVFLPFGEQVYLVPRQMIPLKGLKVIRPGLHLGTNKKNRFEPSHALALYLSPDMVKKHYEMTKEQAESYLRGESFACDESVFGKEQKGWTLLTINGYAAGFGKAGNGQMKNHYPKGLRKERTAICQNG
ncbi:MAG: RsmF rRNA methyltransferase first C-terminal domain-containing protein [Lachnospiraceae bacterium]|nr:RsmF rRNA methyltransferase first C-terminal domain-containing protein [Lachnospiraceae bacterium]